MRDVFFTFAFFAIGASFIVVVLAMMVALLAKWNHDLREQVKSLEPPF